MVKFMKSQKRFKIGVFGSAGGDRLESCKQLAHETGVEVARQNGILCTGACYGLPYEAAISASENNGVILGFSPAMNLSDHVNIFNFPVEPHLLIFTGMEKKGRNLICTRTCDAGIFIAGRWGTMNEFTLMCDEGDGKVIGLLAGSGGFVDECIIPALKTTDKPTKATILIESNPKQLVQKIFKQLHVQ